MGFYLFLCICYCVVVFTLIKVLVYHYAQITAVFASATIDL